MKNKILRWSLVFLGIFFNFLNYFGSPYRLSSKKDCVGPFKCSNGYFYIFIIIFALQVLFIVYLNSIEPPYQLLPKLWWISVPFIFGLLFINAYSGSTTYNFNCSKYNTEDKCNYNKECFFKKDIKKNKHIKDSKNKNKHKKTVPTLKYLNIGTCIDQYESKPWSVFSKGFRSFTTYGLLFILLASFIIEYFNNYIPTNLPIDYVIYNRFGGIKNKPITSSFAWAQILTIILSIIVLHTNNKYIPCKYNLPTNWT